MPSQVVAHERRIEITSQSMVSRRCFLDWSDRMEARVTRHPEGPGHVVPTRTTRRRWPQARKCRTNLSRRLRRHVPSNLFDGVLERLAADAVTSATGSWAVASEADREPRQSRPETDGPSHDVRRHSPETTRIPAVAPLSVLRVNTASMAQCRRPVAQRALWSSCTRSPQGGTIARWVLVAQLNADGGMQRVHISIPSPGWCSGRGTELSPNLASERGWPS